MDSLVAGTGRWGKAPRPSTPQRSNYLLASAPHHGPAWEWAQGHASMSGILSAQMQTTYTCTCTCNTHSGRCSTRSSQKKGSRLTVGYRRLPPLLQCVENNLLEFLKCTVWDIQCAGTGLQWEAWGCNWIKRNWQVKPCGQQQEQVDIFCSRPKGK